MEFFGEALSFMESTDRGEQRSPGESRVNPEDPPLGYPPAVVRQLSSAAANQARPSSRQRARSSDAMVMGPLGPYATACDFGGDCTPARRPESAGRTIA
jgi:hypothetical protein